MKKNPILIASLVGLAITASSTYGSNDRLSSNRSGNFSDKTQVSMQTGTSDYDRAQPNNAKKPVRMDISSKREVDLDSAVPQTSRADRYVVAPENKAKSFPNAAKAGECYGELIYPAEVQQSDQRVMMRPGFSEIEIIPAKYEWVEKQVVVREAETQLELVPSTYKTIEERVLVESKRMINTYIPATFRMEDREILVKAATSVWVDGKANVENQVATNMSGDVICLIESPAQYETVSVQVLDQAARTETRTIPAVYKIVERTVVDVAAHTRSVSIPVEYATIEVRQLLEAERTERRTVDPQYTMISREIESSAAYTQWERVLCQDSIAPALAFEIEQRLNAKGFNPGVIDGNIDADAEQAIGNYQIDNGMAKGGITPLMLESLGILDFENSEDMKVTSM
jgi:hypothetical protein